MTFHINSINELAACVPEVIKSLGEARKIALYGEMGAGKTTFVRMIAQYLGIDGQASSPTFSLINQYRYKDADGRVAYLHHLDLYRLRGAQEAFDIGIEDLLFDPWYCIIEWPQLIEPWLPVDVKKITIEILGDLERVIHVQ